MEHRVVLTKEEAFELSSKLNVLSVGYVRDEYTGLKRFRTDASGASEKDQETPVRGIVYRFSSKCELGGIKGVWFEYKWTATKDRFEIEFEEEVPDEFKNRENVQGWDILKD